ncbi:MAG: hydroxymethylbilane synthase [Planctomycetes bacterium]|jgi:hydroxymethylbilane synthase|nr:hydroxymethylbilane synthase [Planctomycetota bacterium]
MMKLAIGTRASALALAQAREAAEALSARFPGLGIEIVPVKTAGDRATDRPLFEIGGGGLFTREIEERILDGSIDAAVHSLKDLPTALPPGLAIGAVLRRASPADALVSRGGAGLRDLPAGAVVGTSSLRRRALLRACRGDLSIRDLRGNLDTRLGKVASGECDAMVCARAGLDRIGFRDGALRAVDLDDFLPAPGQGAIALEAAEGNAGTMELLRAVDHAETRRCVEAERALLARLGGGCHVPVGALAVPRGRGLLLRGLVADPGGGELVAAELEAAGGPEALGRALGDLLLGRGAARLLAGPPGSKA